MAVIEPVPPEGTPAGPLLRLVRDQRFAFLVVGGINTMMGFGGFVVLHMFLGDGFVRYMSALVGATAFAMLIAFNLHRRFVFKVSGHYWRDLGRFILVNLGVLGTNAVALPLLVEVGGLPVVPAQVLSMGVTVVVSYLGHSLFSFRRPKAHEHVTTDLETGV